MNLGVQMSIDSRTFELSKRQFQIETMTQHALLYGYEISSDVPADGDCFFHCIAHLLGRNVNVVESAAIRRELVAFLKTKVCYFSRLLFSSSISCNVEFLFNCSPNFIHFLDFFYSNSILIIFTL